MPPLYKQRQALLDVNAKLIREWLRQLSPEQQLILFKSLLCKYSVTELGSMNTHLRQQVEHQVGLRVELDLKED
jgi:hypothetical protein